MEGTLDDRSACSKYFTRKMVLFDGMKIANGLFDMVLDGLQDTADLMRSQKNTHHILAWRCTDFYAQLLSEISCKIWKIIFAFQD